MYPRLSMTRRKDKFGKFFGPFPYALLDEKNLKLTTRTLPIRDCNQEISFIKRPQMVNVDIGKCLSSCIYKNKTDYDELIKNITLLLNGKNKEVLKQLERKDA